LKENISLIKPVRTRYTVNRAWEERSVDIGVHVENVDLKPLGRTQLGGRTVTGKITINCIVYKMVVMISLLLRYLMTLIYFQCQIRWLNQRDTTYLACYCFYLLVDFCNISFANEIFLLNNVTYLISLSINCNRVIVWLFMYLAGYFDRYTDM
jgi:hypothetical protein